MLELLAGVPLAGALSGCGRRNPSALEGQALPLLEFPDLAGQRRTSRDFLGAPLLLNVWATWCQPCRYEMPGLDRLYRELNPRGLRGVGISVDEDINLAREYVRESGMELPVWSDPRGRVMTRLLGSSAIPATLLVARDGRVRRVVFGGWMWDTGEARGWVEELLAPDPQQHPK